jgi:1-phosphofructokinase
MIITVTLNPMVDRTMHFPRLQVGELNRASASRVDLGGKGVNVSSLLRRFEVDSVVMGLIAGTMGRLLRDGLQAQGYDCDFVEVAGETRSNVTVIDEATRVTTKLNEAGPTIDEPALLALQERLLQRTRSGDLVVFSGSLPPGVPPNTYERLIRAVHTREALAILDTSGPALALGCAAAPEFIKPNDDEAADLVSLPFETAGQWVRGVRAILQLGPQRVLLSLGRQGALLADRDGIWWGQPPSIVEVSAVGAGDALMAAGLWAWNRGHGAEEILHWAVAAGTATAMEDGSSMPTQERIRETYAQVRVVALA